jgi:hypothetical protein
MDKRILVILIAIIVLLGAIFGIKLMMRDKCEPPKITYAHLIQMQRVMVK